MIAVFLLTPNLCACADIPFGTPHARPGFPIITSGYFSTSDGARLPYRLCPAQGQVRAVVLALHGYTDSRDGWAILAQTLTPQGIAVYAPDISSFGATKNRGHWPGTDVIVEEAREEAVQLRTQYPHTPLFIAGESMGGGIGLLLGAGPNPPPVNGYILSAPAVWGGPTMPTLYRVSAQVVARLDPARRLSSRHVVVLPTDNKAALRAFSRDPLTIHAPRADSLTGLIDLMDQAQSACAHFTQPALILYGGHDQLVPKDAMRRCWQVLPATAPVTLAYYPQGYHLLPRDTDRATPNADILAFILGQGLPSSAPSAATVFLATGD